MKVGVIGAGISGLSAALFLADRGHQVTVFQREQGVGGLISTFDFDGTRIEHFYHFLCGGDLDYFSLCERLGLGEQIKFDRASTGFFYDGKRYPFNTPVDLLCFTPIPLLQRIRFGLFALEARLRKEWRELDQLHAIPWLVNRLGQTAYDIIWDPLLALKFGGFQSSISAAWVWHRVHRVARSHGRMGYLEGGTALLLDKLTKTLLEAGVTIRDGTPVTGILEEDGRVTGLRYEAGEFHCDQVVSTVPMPVLANLLPEGWDDYATSLRRIQYIGVACALFKLARPASNDFWLNVNDTRIPFNGIIEYTNLNPLTPDDGHIVYVPYYVPVNHEFYNMDDDDLLAMSWRGIRKVAPHLEDSDVLARHVARAPYAQAICTVDFLKALPAQRSPLTGLHLLDSIFLYPEDRTQSGQILRSAELARRLGQAE